MAKCKCQRKSAPTTDERIVLALWQQRPRVAVEEEREGQRPDAADAYRVEPTTVWCTVPSSGRFLPSNRSPVVVSSLMFAHFVERISASSSLCVFPVKLQATTTRSHQSPNSEFKLHEKPRVSEVREARKIRGRDRARFRRAAREGRQQETAGR